MSLGLSQSITVRLILWRLSWQKACHALQRHLSATLPDWVLSWFSEHDQKIVYSVTGSRVLARVVKGGSLYQDLNDEPLSCEACGEKELGEAVNTISHEFPKVLIVPENLVLRQELKLPILSLINLRTAIANNLQTWTPFSANEVFFDARIEKIQRDMAFITLVMLPKIQFKNLEGFYQTTFDDLYMDGRKISIRNDQKKYLNLKYLNILLIATLLCSLSLGLSMLNNRLDLAINQLSVEKRNLVRDLQTQKSLEERLSLLLNQAAFLDDRQKYRQPLIPVIAQLANALPANVSLRSFELLRNKGTIVVVFPESPSEDTLRSIILQCAVCKNEYAQLDALRYEFYFKLGES